MTEENKLKFEIELQKLFNDFNLFENSYNFCVKHSLLIEEMILKSIKPLSFSCVMAAVGSFSRRELSPYSNIDLLFIFEDLKDAETKVKKCTDNLWDKNIKISYMIHELSDIKKYLTANIRVFTQFFETRFLVGNKELYNKWNNELFKTIESSDIEKLLYEYFNDVDARYDKYGKSSKILEPNVKFTGGGLRDIHSAEWMYSIKNKRLISSQNETTQTEVFFKELLSNGVINREAYKRLYESYEIILNTRNLLHLVEREKSDRLTFSLQGKVAEKIGYSLNNRKEIMYKYFEASTILNRFSKTMMKRYQQALSQKLSDYLSINLDDDFEIKGNILHFKGDRILSISDIMRAFYYKAMNRAFFETNLRTLIIQRIHLIEETKSLEATSSVFFRELLKLPANVGKTLLSMNDFGVLGVLFNEFKALNGFYQEGVYHKYTADEHSIIAIQNLEILNVQNSAEARIFKLLPAKDLLYMAVLLHDIGKTISITGHEIIGAEIASAIMQDLVR